MGRVLQTGEGSQEALKDGLTLFHGMCWQLKNRIMNSSFKFFAINYFFFITVDQCCSLTIEKLLESPCLFYFYFPSLYFLCFLHKNTEINKSWLSKAEHAFIFGWPGYVEYAKQTSTMKQIRSPCVPRDHRFCLVWKNWRWTMFVWIPQNPRNCLLFFFFFLVVCP